MRKKSIEALLVASLLVMTVACTNPYNNSMDQAKKAMKKQDYSQAISQLEIALIEKPTDKDAQILLKNAKERLLVKESNDKINQYLSSTKDIYQQVITFGKSFDPELVSVDEATEKLPQITDLNNKIKDMHDIWAYDEKFSSAYNNLSSAIDSLEYACERIIENIVDPSLEEALEGTSSRYERIRIMDETTDSKVRVRFSYYDYESAIETYKQNVINLENMLVK